MPKYSKFVECLQIDPQLAKGFIIKDPLLFWRLTPSVKDTNSMGFRGRDISLKKEKGVFRIICMGDSVTYGAKLHIQIQDTYAKKLEDLLNANSPLRKFEVINAGVVGYSSYQGSKYLETVIIKYQPDLVTVHFGHDDLSGAVYFSDKEQKMQPFWLINIQNFLCKSKTFLFMARAVFLAKCKFFNTHYQKKSTYTLRVSPDDYNYNLNKMKETAKRYNFKIVFVTPMRYEEGEAYFNKAYKLPEGSAVVNLLTVFKKEKLSELFIDDCHFTPLGHQIVAEEIFKVLQQEGLVDSNE